MLAFNMRAAALVVADAVLLWLLRPSATVAFHGLAGPQAWLRHDGVDRVAVASAGAGLWCVAAWVGVGLVAVTLGRAPGAVGTCAGRVARVALPKALRRLAVGSAGLGVLLAPLSTTVAHAATPTPDGPGGRPVAAAPALHRGAGGTPLPGPGWPGSGGATDGSGASPSAPGPSWPSAPPTAATPTLPTAPPSKPPSRPPTTTPPPRTTHLVRPDESLWLLGAQRLGPHAGAAEIADYVADTYQANRAVIGDDPDLVEPGQLLTLPPPHLPE